MKFECKASNIKPIDISAEEIVNRAVSDDYGTYDRGMHDPGIKVVLNSNASNVINSTFERGSVELHIVPYVEISVMHYRETADCLIEEPIHYSNLSDEDTELLFDFADFIMTCYINLENAN